MSKITQIYDDLIDRMIALYPERSRLPNPYKPEENSELLVKKGWGLCLDAGVNTNRQVNCSLTIERNIRVVLTQKSYAREMDTQAKASAEKELMEAQFLVIQDFERNPTTTPDLYVAKFVYLSDSGIQFVFTEKDNFLLLDTTFTLEYFEEVN